MHDKHKINDAELAALIAAAAIIVFFTTFWLGEIQSVRDMLELAYG